MNKRIADLMLEAGKTIPGDKQIDADFCEKFAELIVRECANVAADRDALDIYEEIREHFGVEE